MKKIIGILIFVICLSACALPVMAEKEDVGVHATLTIVPDSGHTPSDNVKKIVEDTRANVTAARETIKGQAEDIKSSIRENVTEVKTSIRENISDIKSGIEDKREELARNISELRDSKRQQLEDLNKSLQNETPERRNLVKNQNEVRIAVHTLLSMENRTGGIGQNVSAIAREFNNSVNISENLEEKIRERSGIMRVFIGGDRDAAGQLANITTQNQARIQKIQQLINTATLDPDVRVFLEEQLQAMQSEETRLEQLATREQQDRGLFGSLLGN
jgi:gas vesicle protein